MRTRVIRYAVALSCIHAFFVEPARAQTWQYTDPLPIGGAPRQYAAGVNDGGILYAIGGTPWQNGGDQDGNSHEYSGGTWTAIAPLDGAGPIVSEAAGIDALGRIVVYGGFILGDDGPGPDRVYDPIDGISTAIASRSAPDAAIGYFAWASDDMSRLYGFGGGPGEGGLNSGHCDRYDALTDTWTTLAPLPTPVADACGAYDGNGHMLVIGGINQSGTARVANVARYDIAGNTWSDTAVPDLPVPISGARAVLGADGRVYVVGGESGPLGAGATQTTVYKLEPASNTWVAGPSLNTPRKWFACILGSDDLIYAIGGDNDAGGTDTVETLFTPRCAEITGPFDQHAYAGSVAGFSVSVNGAAPFTYQWRRDGVPLNDGPTVWGSELSGTDTATMKITAPAFDDAGFYDVVVTNDCGAVASTPAELMLQTPAIAPRWWSATNIHPGWADGASYAYGISQGQIGGAANITTTLPDGRVMSLSHPIAWNSDTLAPADITPPGSVGGGIYDVEGNLMVGWFWHTYSCQGGGQWWTCAWQSGCYWWADSHAYTEVHISGAEYDSATATDGQRIVTNAAHEYSLGLYHSYPYLWTPPHSVTYLNPGALVERCSISAIDGDKQYGTLVPIGATTTTHAAMWTGTATSVTDLHPLGFATSSIVGAGDGQAVGHVGSGTASHAALWAGGSATAVELHRPEWGSSDAYATHSGVQVGVVDNHAALWIGSPDSYIDLSAFLPAGFSSSSAQDVEVDSNGAITVVGYGYNPSLGKTQAFLWRSAGLPGDIDNDGDVDSDDLLRFVDCLDGPDVTPACPPDDAARADLDSDGDVDCRDFAGLQSAFLLTASPVPARLTPESATPSGAANPAEIHFLPGE
ncbi:MAG: hypothetical protein H6817_09090 [Phycisphaerales bacterium]|nr:hypothetical protein [Phycisphaerales bacterium]